MEYSKGKYWANCITTIDKGIFAPDSKISWHKKVLETILFWPQILLQNSGKIIVWIWDTIYVMTRESNVVTSCTPIFFFEKKNRWWKTMASQEVRMCLGSKGFPYKTKAGFPADLRASTQRESYIFLRTKGVPGGVELLLASIIMEAKVWVPSTVLTFVDTAISPLPWVYRVSANVFEVFWYGFLSNHWDWQNVFLYGQKSRVGAIFRIRAWQEFRWPCVSQRLLQLVQSLCYLPWNSRASRQVT